MTNVQTAYNVDHKAGVPGLLVDNRSLDAVISKIARTAIPFGVAVVLGSGDGDEGCSVPDTTGEITAGTLLGVSVRDPQLPSTDGYAIGDPVLILTKGRIWVDVEEAVKETLAKALDYLQPKRATDALTDWLSWP